MAPEGLFVSMRLLRSALARLLVEIVLLPWVGIWAWRMEQRILRQGRPLTDSELADAAACGVQDPSRIRVLAVEEVPLPAPRWVCRLGRKCGVGFAPAGMALRHGILALAENAHDRPLLTHEFVHAGQCERLGSLPRFLRRYLMQCLLDGYDAAALEQEARDRSAAVLAQSSP
jgi:hypothetical protein